MRNIAIFITSIIFAGVIQAGTINAPFYFNQDCLAKLGFTSFSKSLPFACDQDGKCFANDMQLNALLLCAQPFGNTEIKTESTKLYLLSNKGFIEKK